MEKWIIASIGILAGAIPTLFILWRIETLVRSLVGEKKTRKERTGAKTTETVVGEIRNYIDAGIRLSDFRMREWSGGNYPGFLIKGTLNSLRLQSEKTGEAEVLYVSWLSLTSNTESTGPVCWVSITSRIVRVNFSGSEEVWEAEISNREKVSRLGFRVGNYVRQFDTRVQ